MTAGGYSAGASCCLVASLASGSGDAEQDDADRLSVEMLAILKRADLFQQMVDSLPPGPTRPTVPPTVGTPPTAGRPLAAHFLPLDD